MSAAAESTSATRQSTCKTRHAWLKGNVETLITGESADYVFKCRPGAVIALSQHSGRLRWMLVVRGNAEWANFFRFFVATQLRRNFFKSDTFAYTLSHFMDWATNVIGDYNALQSVVYSTRPDGETGDARDLKSDIDVS